MEVTAGGSGETCDYVGKRTSWTGCVTFGANRFLEEYIRTATFTKYSFLHSSFVDVLDNCAANVNLENANESLLLGISSFV